MVQIEYEYPLFKVYYSNNSNNSNIRGNPGPQCIVVNYPAMLDTVLRHEEYDPIYGSRNYYDLFHLNC